MIFNRHSGLQGMHALLSASKPYWLNYDEDKLRDYFQSSEAAKRGTELHAFASEAIRLGVKLRTSARTLNLYVNDAIGYRMTPEQLLFYSEFCFGTADAISFSERKSTLRISDLKTGTTKSDVRQLEIYAALFCLEYGHKPFDIRTELRIYQNDECRVYEADPEVVARIMAKIVSFDKKIREYREEEGLS